MSEIWTIYTDGGSRGNPGPAAYAYVIKRPGQPDIEENAYLGRTTNNIAEYTGLVKALEHAAELGGKKLVVNSDSELMVKQLNGQYRVKNEGLRPLYEQAVQLRRKFDSVLIKHVYRDQNKQADALCNEAMDNPENASQRRETSHSLAAPPSPPAATREGMTPTMRALDLLKRSAAEWAESGDPTTPAPAEVLNRLIAILNEADDDA